MGTGRGGAGEGGMYADAHSHHAAAVTAAPLSCSPGMTGVALFRRIECGGRWEKAGARAHVQPVSAQTMRRRAEVHLSLERVVSRLTQGQISHPAKQNPPMRIKVPAQPDPPAPALTRLQTVTLTKAAPPPLPPRIADVLPNTNCVGFFHYLGSP